VCEKRLFETLEANPSLMSHDCVAAAPESLGNVVWLSIGAMLEQLEPNLYEDKSLERFVDFGHTFSPAFETLSAYSVGHGQAVALDISLCVVMSWRAGTLSTADRDRILTLLGRAGLATFSPLVSLDVCLLGIEEAMRHRGGSVNLVVPTGVGNAIFVSDVRFIEAMVRDSIRWLARNADVEARSMPRNPLRAEAVGRSHATNRMNAINSIDNSERREGARSDGQ
jgi:3-dehydroquinate synthase